MSDNPRKDGLVSDNPRKDGLVSDNPRKDGLVSDNPRKDGLVSDNPRKDGLVSDNPRKDGLVSDNPRKDGLVSDNPRKDRLVSDNPRKDGLVSDNPRKDGLVSDNPRKDGLVSDNPRKDGLGPTNRPSTLPHYKPSISYFTPSLKIRKLNKEQLIPGAEPPIRLITALQDSVTKRSDVYLAESILKQLEKDFCADLLTDTTDALKWLEGVNTEFEEYDKSKFRAFTFDFKCLYDSLSPDLVIETLRTAMKECRPDWSQEYTEWLITVVNMGLRSSIGVFDGA